MEKLDRTQNGQFWGLKTWGQGGPGPWGPLDLLMGVQGVRMWAMKGAGCEECRIYGLRGAGCMDFYRSS